MLELGKEAKDIITGFTGTIVSRVQYLTGCDQYCLVPKMKGGKLMDGEYFDENRLEVIGKGLSRAFKNTTVDPGGPQRDSPKR